ncbi:PC4 and SFRS1-interacting protein-like isoform X2 [Dioscorea cayenensis subsp. rotundata]|uniref:PC4 and SFRS1-interacting protein-like isoform X2 n=1 Tax=Dioscorea cayennensis subsp. rotundata TaxID=55577 RepID=A0AB40B0U1_DIOCR|nr:PC4 and SFRS1-interacting protein-like isoform X2 [Dioscorea cayenensis subsp. rotundata]
MPRKSSRNIQNQLSNDDCETNRYFVRQVGKHLRLQPGDTLWTKVNGCSWWPAQVVNDKRISNRFKRKAEGEVLVRLYGTYEYVSVDPVKSHSEFANKLKQENSKKHEVFQKALEEVLSHAKSGCNSKKKVSRCSEIVASVNSKIKRQKTSGNSMGKRREQHVVERSQENQSPASPEAQTDNVKKSKSVRQRRRKSKAEAFGDNKSRKYDLRKTKDREQKNVSMDKDQKNMKDVVCVKSGENATATKENTASKASRGKKPEKISTNNDDADGLAIPETRSREAAVKESSAIPKKRGKALQENKTKKNEVKKRKARDASEDNIIEANVSKKPNLARSLRDKTSDVRTAIQDVVNQTVKKKSNAKACNGKLTKKAKNEVVDVKSSKQNISTPPKETLRTKSPISKVAEAEEESMSIKMKVMQSLGLIAPSGSPFKRNLVTKGGRRIF